MDLHQLARFDEPPQGSVIRDPIAAERLGCVTLAPTGDFEAGSYASFTLVYTAGKHGIDDSGSIRLAFRFASDQSRPQFDDPKGVGYTTVEASNNAMLEYRYDPKGNVRPWDRALTIKVVHGFLTEGDTITIRLGDTRQGSPGIRLQTFCEDSFEFRVLVDPIATVNYQAVKQQATIRIIPGAPQRWVAVLPTLRRAGEPFRLSIKTEDAWGNPSNQVDATLRLHASSPVQNLPASLRFRPGQFTSVTEGLTVEDPGDITIDLLDEAEHCSAVPTRCALCLRPISCRSGVICMRKARGADRHE